MDKQPTINIGVIGHVSHGKTTIVQKLTTKDTRAYRKEMVTNKTIKVGYANAKIFKCDKCNDYRSGESSLDVLQCNNCNNYMKLVRHVSFVDCPGHNTFMSVMLNGTAVMDTTICVISANDVVPAKQTKEHIIAASKVGLDIKCILLNKIDLVEKDEAMNKIKQINKFLDTYGFHNIPIIPISANYNINMKYVCDFIANNIKDKVTTIESIPKLITIRSFNINAPYIPINKLKGGVIGGSIMNGIIKPDDKVVILPGFYIPNEEGGFIYQEIVSKVVSIKSENNDLPEANSGGLVGIQLTIDSSFTVQDKLAGNLMFKADTVEDIKDYDVYDVLFVKFTIIDEFDVKDKKLLKNDILIINCNSKNITCRVNRVKNKSNKIELKLLDMPICAKLNDTIAISRKNKYDSKLIGTGIILDGMESKRA